MCSADCLKCCFMSQQEKSGGVKLKRNKFSSPLTLALNLSLGRRAQGFLSRSSHSAVTQTRLFKLLIKASLLHVSQQNAVND